MLDTRWVALVAVAVVAWGVQPMLQKLATQNGVRGTQMVLLSLVGNGAMTAILNAGSGVTGFAELSTFAIVASMVVGCISVIGNYCFIRAISIPGVSVSVTTSLAALYPAVTFLLCVVVAGERVSFYKVMGVTFSAFAAYCFSIAE